MAEETNLTEVRSVSVSKDFIKYLDKYKLSPTEVFRKGMAVCLFEAGENRFQTETNKKRAEYTEAFIEKYNRDKELKTIFDNLISLAKIIEENEQGEESL